MEIRRLLESDAQEFRTLRLEALESEPSSFAEAPEEMLTIESYAKRLRDNTSDNFVVGAFHNSKLVGMAGFFRETRIKRHHKGTVWGVYVSPDHRGQGIARTVLTEVLKTACTIPDLKWIALSVSVERAPARELYLSLGFQPWGIERGALKVGETLFDEEFMALEVNQPKP